MTRLQSDVTVWGFCNVYSDLVVASSAPSSVGCAAFRAARCFSSASMYALPESPLMYGFIMGNGVMKKSTFMPLPFSKSIASGVQSGRGRNPTVSDLPVRTVA